MSDDLWHAREICLKCSGASESVSVGLVFDKVRADYTCSFFRIGGRVFDAIRNVNGFNTWGYLVRVDDPLVRSAIDESFGGGMNPLASGNEFVRSVFVECLPVGRVRIELMCYLVRQGPCSLQVYPKRFVFLCCMARVDNLLGDGAVVIHT